VEGPSCAFASSSPCRCVSLPARAIAAACNGGTCPAANLIVSNIVSPQSAGTVSSVRVEARTSNGATATLYAGTIHAVRASS